MDLPPPYISDRIKRSLADPNGVELIASNDEKIILSRLEAYNSEYLRALLKEDNENTRDWPIEKYKSEPLSISVIPFNLDVKISADILKPIVEALKYSKDEYRLKAFVHRLILTNTPDFIIKLIHMANYFEIQSFFSSLISEFLDFLSNIHANDLPMLFDWKLDPKTYLELYSKLSHQLRRIEELYPTTAVLNKEKYGFQSEPLSEEQKKFPIPENKMSYILFSNVLMMTEERFDSDESFISVCRELQFPVEKDFTKMGEVYMFTHNKFKIFLLQIPNFNTSFDRTEIYAFRRVKETIEMKEIPKGYQHLIDTYRKQVFFNLLWTHPNMYFDIMNVIMEKMVPYYYGNHKCLTERVFVYPELVYLNINIGKYAIYVDQSHSNNFAINLLTEEKVNLTWKDYPAEPNLFIDENQDRTIFQRKRNTLYGVISQGNNHLHFYGWTLDKMDKQLADENSVSRIHNIANENSVSEIPNIADENKSPKETDTDEEKKETTDENCGKDFMADISFEINPIHSENLSVGELHVTSNRIVVLLTNFQDINTFLVYDHHGEFLKKISIPPRGVLTITERYIHATNLWFDLYLLKKVPILKDESGRLCSNKQQMIISEGKKYLLYNEGKMEELPLIKEMAPSLSVESFENKKVVFCGKDESKNNAYYVWLYDLQKGTITKLMDTPVDQYYASYFVDENNLLIDMMIKNEDNKLVSIVSHINLASGIGRRIEDVHRIFCILNDGFIYETTNSEVFKYSIDSGSQCQLNDVGFQGEVFSSRDINRLLIIGRHWQNRVMV